MDIPLLVFHVDVFNVVAVSSFNCICFIKESKSFSAA